MTETGEPTDDRTTQLSPDRPIEKSAEDELGRTKFAEDIAQAIAVWQQRDSIVFGLVGPWGDGKTSIKNLVMEELGRRASPDEPAVLEFRPWEWAAQGTIVSAFFRELAGELKLADTSDEGRKRAEALLDYGELLQSTSSAIQSFPTAAAGIAAGVAALGASQLTSGVAKTALTALAVACELAALGIGTVGHSFTAIGRMRLRRFDRQEPSVKSEKEKLATLMREGFPHAPMLVVLDDLDRLDAEELREVLQLIRANVDLPNLVYLLLYDETALTKTLDVMYPGRGQESLEKVINLRLAVPRLQAGQLGEFAKRKVVETVEAAGHSIDQLYWENVAASGWGQLVDNLRTFKRFINIFTVHLSILTTDGSLEVNAADLAAIDLLSVAEPDLHTSLPDSKNLLTRDSDRSNQATRRIELSALLEKASPVNRDACNQLLLRLFDPLSSVVGNTFHGDWQYRNWWAQRRVCSLLAFDIYFTLTIPMGEASGSAVQSLLEASADEGLFLEQLESLKSAGVLRSALHQLSEDRVPPANNAPILRALFRAGDSFLPTEVSMPLTPRDEGAAADLIRRLCRRRLAEDAYIDCYIESIHATHAVYLPTYMASTWELSPQSLEGPLSEQSASRLKAACLEAIRQAADDGRLEELPGLGYLLFRWKEWGDPTAVQEWLRARIPTAEAAVEYVLRLGGYRSAGPAADRVHRATFEPNRGALEALVGKQWLDAVSPPDAAPGSGAADAE